MNAIEEMDIDHAGSDVRKIILGSGSNKVEEAFQSLDRPAGKRGAPFLLLPLWTEVTSDTQPDIFRMQFYTAAALAARAGWQTIDMLVNREAADEMAELFGAMKSQYLDPPRVIPDLLEQLASFGIPTRLSEVKIDRERARSLGLA